MSISAKLLFCFLLLTLSACVPVKVKNYIHPDTAALRNSFDWSVRSKPLDRLISDEMETPILIPDFYRFWPGQSGRGLIRVIMREDKSLQIDEVKLWSPDTKELIVVRTQCREPRNFRGFQVR